MHGWVSHAPPLLLQTFWLLLSRQLAWPALQMSGKQRPSVQNSPSAQSVSRVQSAQVPLAASHSCAVATHSLLDLQALPSGKHWFARHTRPLLHSALVRHATQ